MACAQEPTEAPASHSEVGAVPSDWATSMREADLPPENTKQISKDKIRRGPLKRVETLVKAYSTVHPAPTSCKVGARLVTVNISHYAEKARWGLDTLLAEHDGNTALFDYVEDAHPPAIASVYTTDLDPATSATPIIEVVDNELGQRYVLKDSTAILKRLCPYLYPFEAGTAEAAQLDEWEEFLDRRLGTTVRVYAYQKLLGRAHSAVMSDLATRGTSWIETKVFTAAASRGLVQPGMKKFMGISEDSADRGLVEIRQIFDKVGKELNSNSSSGGGGGVDHKAEDDGARRYIMGNEFTAADLTFASLASPLLNLDEFSDLTPPMTRFPQELRETIDELRATPAGQHAIRVYREYRGARFDRASGRLLPRAMGATSAPYKVTFRLPRGGARNNLLSLGLTAGAAVTLPLAAACAVVL